MAVKFDNQEKLKNTFSPLIASRLLSGPASSKAEKATKKG